MNTKVIIKPSIARKLFHMGNELIDFKPKKEDKQQTVFVFKKTDKLMNDLTTITKQWLFYYIKNSQKEGINSEKNVFR